MKKHNDRYNFYVRVSADDSLFVVTPIVWGLGCYVLFLLCST